MTFLKNHAVAAEELRDQFPLKKGALMERDKIAIGLEGLRKRYGTSRYLDLVFFPETRFSSNATVDLNITIQEGPQYRMGKLEIVAEKEPTARLLAQWNLAEGDIYDNTYIDDFLAATHDLLPANFSRTNAQITQNCPEALVQARLVVDPTQDALKSQTKNVPCEEHNKAPK